MGTRIGLLKIPVLNLVLCLVLCTCFAFYYISAVLRDRCWFCCSVLTATVINEHYYIINIIIIIIDRINRFLCLSSHSHGNCLPSDEQTS